MCKSAHARMFVLMHAFVCMGVCMYVFAFMCVCLCQCVPHICRRVRASVDFFVSVSLLVFYIHQKCLYVSVTAFIRVFVKIDK